MDKVTFFTREGNIHQTFIERGDDKLLKKKIDKYLFNHTCRKYVAMLAFLITGGYIYCILREFVFFYRKRRL